jgi:hypothetical protein
MANTTFKNAAGGVEYNKSTGVGTDVDPKIMEVSVAACTTLSAALDAGTETPAVAVEDATIRTTTSLLKGIKNTLYNAGNGLLISIASGKVASGAIASGAIASGAIVSGADVSEGATSDTPAVAVEDNTARTVISLLKGIKNILYNAGVGVLTTDGGWAGPTTVWGVSGVPVTSADLTGSGAAVTDVSATLKTVMLECHVTSAVNVKLTFTETSGAILFYVRCPANCTVSKVWRGKKKTAAANKTVVAVADIAGAVTIDMGYYYEA